MMKKIYLMMWFLTIVVPDSKASTVRTELPDKVVAAINITRRILKGHEITDSRPYMVYLKLPATDAKHEDYRGWVCGGVIVHEEYVLTSAACVQDAEHFYVVSGTYKYTPDENPEDNECIKNGQKKAIWKCVPKDYVFDGKDSDNIRWLHNDIAVVRVEEPFSFTHKVKGCDFVPRMLAYNNHSKELEAEGTTASVAGWGSTRAFHDWSLSLRQDGDDKTSQAQTLLEADVEIIDTKKCKKRWGQRYRDAIEKYMICTKDSSHDAHCDDNANCHNIDFEDKNNKKDVKEGKDKVQHGAATADSVKDTRHQSYNARRAMGGFCENDHGGPLVHGYGSNAEVIGIIAASKVKERTHACYGPFLYTSVFHNRHFINCAIYKTTEKTCSLRYRMDVIETAMPWSAHPDGPAKGEARSNTLKSREKSDDDSEEAKTKPNESFEWNTALIQKPKKRVEVISKIF